MLINITKFMILNTKIKDKNYKRNFLEPIYNIHNQMLQIHPREPKSKIKIFWLKSLISYKLFRRKKALLIKCSATQTK